MVKLLPCLLNWFAGLSKHRFSCMICLQLLLALLVVLSLLAGFLPTRTTSSYVRFSVLTVSLTIFLTFIFDLGLYLRLLYFLNFCWHKTFWLLLYLMQFFSLFLRIFFFSCCVRIASVSLIFVAVSCIILSQNEAICSIKTNENFLELEYQLFINSL